MNMLESFFIFIGGVQPKITVLDETPRRCPRCGLNRARLQRVDHYLSLFFIPLLKVKTGEPALVCERCAAPVEASGGGGTGTPAGAEKFCRFCQKRLPADYAFCPTCGRRL